MGDTEPDMKRSRALSVESSPLSYSFTSFKKNPDLQDTLLRYLGVRSIEEIFEVVDGFKLSEGHTPVIDGDDFELLITRLKSVLKHVSLEYEAGVRIFVNDILLCVAEKCNLAIFPEKQVSRDLSTVPPVKLKGPVDYFISPLVDTIWLSKKSDGFFIIETKRAGLALDAIPTEGIQLVAQVLYSSKLFLHLSVFCHQYPWFHIEWTILVLNGRY
eukprot:TRINITY_DN1809_c0_g1_i5.p1 TRINITY_DN1809_c0_g1~~TRINITY_DN1809_c0_g1_i5.p1  ORF type:complete len:232 (-),score=31.53 TRINITY_DN1809_c0_g1_i5:1883-2527(-)